MAVGSQQQMPPQQMPPPMPPQMPPQYPQYGAPPQQQKTAMPIAGGILLLVVGILGIIVAVMVMGSGAMVESIMGGVIPGLEDLLVVLGAIGVICSLVVILGGFFATQRKHFALALIGGIFSLAVGPFVWLFGFVLGLVGLILIAVSHKEFD